MSAGARSLPPGGNPIRSPEPRQAISAQVARRRVGWTAPIPIPLADIPGLASLPILDGDASVAASRPASAMGESTGLVGLPVAGVVRRRRAKSNLCDAAATTSEGSPSTNPLDSNGLVTRFGNFNVRTGETPVSNKTAVPASAPIQAPAPAQWPVAAAWTSSKIERVKQARMLARYKQAVTDQFYHFHASLDHWAGWNRNARREYWQRLPMPPEQGAWPGHPPLEPDEGLGPLSQYRQHLARNRSPPGMRVLHRIRSQVNRVRRGGIMGRLRRERDAAALADGNPRVPKTLDASLADEFKPAAFRFKRRLGQGGFGAVFLFEMVAERGAKYPIVVKASTRETPAGVDAFDLEIKNLTWMNGALHFIQRRFLQDLPLPATRRRRQVHMTARDGLATIHKIAKRTRDIIYDYAKVGKAGTGGQRATSLSDQSRRPPPPDAPGADRVSGYTAEELEALRAMRWDLDNSRNIIVLENMPRGDLIHLLTKLATKKMRLSNRALWTIFECLFKSCVGMATPGLFHEAGKDPNAHAMAGKDETVPEWLLDGAQTPDRPMVHFDLDPQNALVGNFGEPGGPHENIPIVKIADPGLAVIVDDGVRNDETTLWMLRMRGKPGYLQPEQFTREWEYRAAIDWAHLAIESTAGNYNWWSNLYQVGWIMWSLVTQCIPPAPPRAWPYTYASEEPGVIKDMDGFTYGMHLMATDYDYCDLELRRQILRCLDHEPTQRPKMGWLEVVFMYNMGRPDLVHAESDEQLRSHMNSIYGDP